MIIQYHSVMLYVVVSILIGCSHPSNDTIKATVVDRTSDNYEVDIESYKTNEFWGIWSMPIGIPTASSNLSASGDNNYKPENLSDYNLNTAWIPNSNKNWGVGESFEFNFHFPENTSYAGAYQFFGICNVFNGYCKSKEAWNANSRVKMLKVYYNDIFICYVELNDTWHFQSFDISKYFINRRDKKFLDAHYEVVEGGRLKFEIFEVYKGTKYRDTAISEFLCEGAGN